MPQAFCNTREAKAGFGNRCRKHQESGTGKLGLNSEEQKEDTNYLDGIRVC